MTVPFTFASVTLPALGDHSLLHDGLLQAVPALAPGGLAFGGVGAAASPGAVAAVGPARLVILIIFTFHLRQRNIFFKCITVGRTMQEPSLT